MFRRGSQAVGPPQRKVERQPHCFHAVSPFSSIPDARATPQLPPRAKDRNHHSTRNRLWASSAVNVWPSRRVMVPTCVRPYPPSEFSCLTISLNCSRGWISICHGAAVNVTEWYRVGKLMMSKHTDKRSFPVFNTVTGICNNMTVLEADCPSLIFTVLARKPGPPGRRSSVSCPGPQRLGTTAGGVSGKVRNTLGVGDKRISALT